jgi:hypothetical protein
MITGAAAGLALLAAMVGGLGVLVGGAGHKVGAQVTAAVLIYRADTYLPSIPLGALACLTWRYAPALISTSPRRLPRQAHITTTALAGAARRFPEPHPRPAHDTTDPAV